MLLKKRIATTELPDDTSMPVSSPSAWDDWSPANLLPLAVVALELDTTVTRLAERLGEDVVLDDIGMRCCTRAAAAALIGQRNARRAAEIERDRRQRAEAKQRPALVRQRIEAIKAAQERIGAPGLLRDEP